MVFETIFKVIEQNGFTTVQVNVADVKVGYRVLEDGVYVVGIFRFIDDGFIKEKHQNIIRQIRDNFERHYGKEINILTIMTTKDSLLAKEIFADMPSVWIVDERKQKLLIYESQIPNFLNIRASIEDALYQLEVEESKNWEQKDVINKKEGSIPIFVILIFANFIVFLLVNGIGYTPPFAKFIKIGALSWNRWVHEKEYSRLITYMFLHSGIQHLANNMLLLVVLGRNVEKILGKVKFTILYLLSGILAGTGSMLFNMYLERNVVSIGASGAIFGIVGAMLYFVIAGKGIVTDISNRQMILFVAFSLYGGLSSLQVDNAAHISGLIAGIFLGAILKKRIPIRGKVR